MYDMMYRQYITSHITCVVLHYIYTITYSSMLHTLRMVCWYATVLYIAHMSGTTHQHVQLTSSSVSIHTCSRCHTHGRTTLAQHYQMGVLLVLVVLAPYQRSTYCKAGGTYYYLVLMDCMLGWILLSMVLDLVMLVAVSTLWTGHPLLWYDYTTTTWWY